MHSTQPSDLRQMLSLLSMGFVRSGSLMAYCYCGSEKSSQEFGFRHSGELCQTTFYRAATSKGSVLKSIFFLLLFSLQVCYSTIFSHSQTVLKTCRYDSCDSVSLQKVNKKHSLTYGYFYCLPPLAEAVNKRAPVASSPPASSGDHFTLLLHFVAPCPRGNKNKSNGRQHDTFFPCLNH